MLKAFHDYQKAAKAGGEIPIDILENLKEHAIDFSVIQNYIDYDVQDRKIDAGWSHPAVLQALASIQKIELHIWIKGENQLQPHWQYPHLIPAGVKEKKHLLFVNGNHFELLSEHIPRENLPQNLEPQAEKKLNVSFSQL